MKSDFLRATVLALLTVLVTACGQRGPLYLPSKTTAAIPAQTSGTNTAAPSSSTSVSK